MSINSNHTLRQETQPLLTFIVCYYNLPIELLHRCLDSILALKLQPCEREIIVVDDGSDVNLTNDFMQYGDDVIYVRQKHSGLSCARNLGLSLAKGRCLQFVDSDDYLMTTYNHCLDLLRSHDNADMIIFNFTTVSKVSHTFVDSLPISGSEYMLHNNIRGTAWGYIFRREILHKLRFTPRIYHEDEEFTPLLLLRAKYVYITNARAYYYYQRSNSITSTTDKQKVQKRLDDLHTVTHRLHLISKRLSQDDHMALQRRVAQLTMDYLYQIIMLTHSAQQLNTRIAQLHNEGLFPLPDEDYSQKYIWFRRIMSTALGRTLLLHSLPFTHKER